jgi:RNA polymerase sigma factor (sigma-70 family)
LLSETEEDLVRAAQAVNVAAFERLVMRLEHQMLALAAGYANSSDDANDIYQDAMIAAYRSLSQFRSESKFSTWLYRIVVNTALSHRRKFSRVMEQLIALKGSYEDEEHYCTQTPESRMLSFFSSKKRIMKSTNFVSNTMMQSVEILICLFRWRRFQKLQAMSQIQA